MSERDYVLGTHDAEIDRLALQHAVWRARAREAWLRAGFGAGQTILDVGCGPGFAAADLAELVGTGGKVIALDRSRRFLDVLASRGLPNVELREGDLDETPLPRVDGAWVRWVFAFVQRPRALVERLAAALRPGGTLVVQEYFDYASWRDAPPSAELAEIVREVMASWRASGGEPDIALPVAAWLRDAGFELRSVTPVVLAAAPGTPEWAWLTTFLEVGTERLVALGRVSADRAAALLSHVREAKLMITPGVLQLVATRG